MLTECAGQPGEGCAFGALVDPACEMRRTVGDGVVAPRDDAPSLGSPCEELFAHVAQLCAQVACRAPRPARCTGPAFAVLVEVVGNGEQHALGIGCVMAFGHTTIIPVRVSRKARAV